MIKCILHLTITFLSSATWLLFLKPRIDGRDVLYKCSCVFLRVCVVQLVRECKEVLKGGLLMKQYYQFMLRGVVTDAQGLQTNSNIDEFEEDLHKMLVVSLLLPLLTATHVK